jgi:hypothetical protein
MTISLRPFNRNSVSSILPAQPLASLVGPRPLPRLLPSPRPDISASKICCPTDFTLAASHANRTEFWIDDSPPSKFSCTGHKSNLASSSRVSISSRSNSSGTSSSRSIRPAAPSTILFNSGHSRRHYSTSRANMTAHKHRLAIIGSGNW